MQRRHAMGAMGAAGALIGCGAALLGAAPASAAAPVPGSAWPAWSRFKAQFISADGRVQDLGSARRHTVSEGQAYALFFALVANDRAGFEQLLRWTENNLCQGDLSAHLPAWQWGQQDNGQWGVIDSNSASDADLWLAYALGEAGRLWGERRYRALSSLVSARVLREETAELPGLGLTLLPGPKGFASSPQLWRLNASYSPPQLLQWLAHYAEGVPDLAASPGPSAWSRLAQSGQKVTLGSAPKGFCADWVLYDAQQGFVPDLDGPAKSQGSYNAIRVYLWAGTLHPDAVERAALLRALRPMAQHLSSTGQAPESIDTHSGQATRPGPPGFAAALLPFLQAQQDSATLHTLRAQLQAQPAQADAYYDQALSLFALGWMDGHYRYAADGRLLPRWSQP